MVRTQGRCMAERPSKRLLMEVIYKPQKVHIILSKKYIAESLNMLILNAAIGLWLYPLELSVSGCELH